MRKEEVLALLRSRWPELCALGVAELYLFGSLARGEATPRSDADLLLLVGEAPPFLERPGRYLPLFADLGFPVDLFVYTPKEAEANPLARRALAEGRVLAERKG